MTTEAADTALQYVQQLVPDLKRHSAGAGLFNTLPNIPWHLRQQVRTIEGKLDGILEDCADLVTRLDTDDAYAYLEEQWPGE